MSPNSLGQRLTTYCQTRLRTALSDDEAVQFQAFLISLVQRRLQPPTHGAGLDWAAISEFSGVPLDRLRATQKVVRPPLDAITRTFPLAASLKRPVPVKAQPTPSARKVVAPVRKAPAAADRPPPMQIQRLGRPPSPRGLISRFAEALDGHMRRRGDTATKLHRAIVQCAEDFDPSTLRQWRRGDREPVTAQSLRVLKRIEEHYGLEPDALRRLLGDPSRASSGQSANGVRYSELRRLAWHLPDDFDLRPAQERATILEWVRANVISGGTDYRRYQAQASRDRFGLRFDIPDATANRLGRPQPLQAPQRLNDEIGALVAFKTATLTPFGFNRNGSWGTETAAQKVEHLSLLFGALAASEQGPTRGAGVHRDALGLGLLASTAIWDWYLRWRLQRRGFYTAWEIDMLMVAQSLVRSETGWLRQNPGLADRLEPIAGLLSPDEVRSLQLDWSNACDRLGQFANARAKEIQKIARVHRDPFEPILCVLEAEKPLNVYRRIADEIERLMPDTERYPKAAAEAVRSLLMFRVAVHSGLRQKNLRQLLVCLRGSAHRSERRLSDLKRGELRFSEKEAAWEIFIPAVAFKNADSSFFGKKPFRLVLPDVAGLYELIDRYLTVHRTRLLGHLPDPGTVFIKSVSTRTASAEYDATTFYEAWRLLIARYGVFNPYTGRGAIAGLLPHGPHNVRDVLATHVLKSTGSYQQASYAIQDTPEVVAKHYGRFLPEDKSAMAARILNLAWLDAA